MAVNSSIIEKIQKLLALADPTRNSSEAERDNAMAAVRELLDAHQLDMSQIDNYTTPGSIKVVQSKFTEIRLNPWLKLIYGVICELFDCISIISRVYDHKGHPKQIPLIVGTPDNIATVQEMVLWISKSIKKEANRYSTYSPEQRSFCTGASISISHTATRLKLQRQAQSQQHQPTEQSTQLMVIKQSLNEANKKYIEDKFPSIKTEKPKAKAVEANAYFAGRSYGTTLHLGKQIGDHATAPKVAG